MRVELPSFTRDLGTWAYVPGWHRAMYNAAAHRVHWAERESVDPSFLRRFGIRSALLDAERVCLRLLYVAARVVGSRGRWAVLRLPAHVDRHALQLFLENTVEPSAAILLAGIRLDLGVEPGDREVPARKRSSLVEELEAEERTSERRMSPSALVAYAREAPGSGRVDYNLACYYSSLAVAGSTEGANLDDLRVAAQYLRRSLERMPVRDREKVIARVREDPSLRALQVFARTEFDAIVRPYEQLQVEEPDEKQEWWLLEWRPLPTDLSS